MPLSETSKLQILYDAARSFVGLSDAETIVRNGLLTVIGAVGSRSAAFLEPVDNSEREFEVIGSRGIKGTVENLKLGAQSRDFLLGDPGPHILARTPQLGARLNKYSERNGFHLILGLTSGDNLRGLIVLGERIFTEPYSAEEVELVATIGDLLNRALEGQTTARRSPATRRAGLSARSAPKNIRAKLQEFREAYPPLQQIVGQGHHTLHLYDELVALSDFELPVLIQGESGTGKELVAQTLHKLRSRADHPFEAINCAGVSSDLINDELFGHEPGGFTDAKSRRRGLFERAGEGTVFLDEIGDMPLKDQANLLRVLQQGEFLRLGGETLLPMHARILTATNRDLTDLVADGSFRADLFYRIRMYSLTLTPLRERTDDIPLLLDHIIDKTLPKGRQRPQITSSFVHALKQRPLRGNVRELEGLIASALVRARKASELLPEHLQDDGYSLESTRANSTSLAAEGGGSRLPESRRTSRTPTSNSQAPRVDPSVPTYSEMERQYITEVLELTHGNKKEAARLMKIKRNTLYGKMRRLGLV